MMKHLTSKYIKLCDDICKEFYKRYFWNRDFPLKESYNSECYLIGSGSKRMWSPPGPLDIREGIYIFNTYDIRTALEWDIPRHILIDWYDKHQDGYNIDDYGKVNLWHYYRQNYDPEICAEEQRIEIEESRKRSIETSYLLDDALGIERGTSYQEMQKTISSLYPIKNNEHSSSENLGE